MTKPADILLTTKPIKLDLKMQSTPTSLACRDKDCPPFPPAYFEKHKGKPIRSLGNLSYIGQSCF